MELRINLADQEEVAAAIPLLQAIIAGLPGREADIHLSATGNLVSAAEVFGGGTGSPLAPAVPGAPSTAAVFAFPTAPGATPGNTSTAAAPAYVPPAPNGASAPGPAVPPAAPPASNVELDKNGLPWDERIHASTKTKIKSGEWKAKKGVDAALVPQIEAELRARVAATPAAVVGTQPWPFPDPNAALGVAAASAPFVPPAAPLAPAAPAAPLASADPTTFEQLMPRITAAVSTNVLPATAVGQACAHNGVASVVTLQQQPAFVPLVWATLKQMYPALL